MVSTHTDNPARSLDCPRWIEAVEASCNVESLASEGVLGEGVSEFVSPGLAQNVHSLKLDILLRSSDVCSVLVLQIIIKSLTLHDIHNEALSVSLLGSCTIAVIVVPVNFSLNSGDHPLQGSNHVIDSIKFWVGEPGLLDIDS